MKTPNGHNMQVFHGPVLDHQLHVPSRLQPIPRLGTQLTWKVNCGRVHGAQAEAENPENRTCLVFPRAELTKKKYGSLTGTVLSQVLEMLVEAPKNWFEPPFSIIKTNNNDQQHKNDTIPCAQATLSVCDCMKYTSSSTVRAAWAKQATDSPKLPQIDSELAKKELGF